MKKLRAFWVILTAFLLFSVTVLADSGPKPALSVEIIGLAGETYWVTALSKTGSGPWGADREYQGSMGDRDVWYRFAAYEDLDGFKFLGNMQDCSESGCFEWPYYPPEEFRLLIYFPEKDSFLASEEICRRYAFHSYFTVDLSGVRIEENTSETVGFQVRESYNYGSEWRGLAFRAAVTAAAELLLALLFGFRRWKQLLVILFTNLATQFLLNLALNAITYFQGPGLNSWMHLIWMEIVVIVVEGAVYSRALPRLQGGESKRASYPWAYAWTANLVSCLLGLFLMVRFPALF